MGPALQAYMTEGVIVQDRDGRVVQWNPAALRILGLTADDLASRNSLDARWDAVHPDGRAWPGDTHPAMLTLSSGAPVVGETIGLRRGDGALVWLQMHTFPERGPEGDLCGVTTLFTDLTADRDDAANQDVAERRLRRTFERSPVGQLVVAPGGRFVDANLAVAELLGRTITEILTLDLYDLAAREIAPELSAAILAPPEEGALSAPIEFRRPDGEVRRGLTQIYEIEWAVPDATGAAGTSIATCSMVQVVDITELVRSKLESERSLRALRGAFENSPIGMAVVNPHGFIQESNAAFARLLSRQTAELHGIPLDLVVHDEDLDMVKRFAMKSTERASVALEHRVVRADGEIRWLRTHWSRMDTDGGPRLLAQSLDTTAERRRDVLLSSVDALTGLLTREGLVTALEDLVFSHPVSTDAPLAMLAFDIDHFQQLNERLGAHGADQVLRRLAATIRASMPPDVHMARVGGDVFVALAPGVDATVATRTAERIRERFADALPGATSGEPVTVRTGHVLVTRLDVSPADLVQRAETTVRRDARAGAGPAALATRDAAGTDAADWSDAIEDALRRQRFTAVAEPLLALRGSSVRRRYELLVRLVMPDGSQLSLPKFERLALRLGHAGALDAWMTDRALQLLAAREDLELEVNLGVTAYADPGFLRSVERRIHASDVDPGRLMFAVTERSVLDDVPRALSFVDAARDLGVRVGIDDFGLSQSGRALEVNVAQVKFSGQLVRAAGEQRHERSLLTTLTVMARDAGADVAAPFVNDLAGLDLLREIGVDLAQGRLIGGPVASDELLRE